MIWINLPTSMLRSPEFIGSEPVARATWLAVLGYCFEQENGGRIANVADWKDRQWQQTCGVTIEEVRNAAPLVCWDGDSVTVWGYPIDKQKEVQAKRVGGHNGGKSKSEAKAKAARSNGANHNPSLTQAQPKLEPNGREGKGRELEEKGNKEEEEGRDAGSLLTAEVQHAEPHWQKGLGWKGISGEHRQRWAIAYPACNIDRQLAQMNEWLIANPKEANKKDWARFVTNWLKREQDKGGDTRADRRISTASPNGTTPAPREAYGMDYFERRDRIEREKAERIANEAKAAELCADLLEGEPAA